MQLKLELFLQIVTQLDVKVEGVLAIYEFARDIQHALHDAHFSETVNNGFSDLPANKEKD